VNEGGLRFPSVLLPPSVVSTLILLETPLLLPVIFDGIDALGAIQLVSALLSHFTLYVLKWIVRPRHRHA
jgi:hypothetical protein